MKEYMIILVALLPMWFVWATCHYGTASLGPAFVFGAFLMSTATYVLFAIGLAIAHRFTMVKVFVAIFCAMIIGFCLKINLPVDGYSLIYLVDKNGFSYTHIVTGFFIAILAFLIGVITDSIKTK